MMVPVRRVRAPSFRRLGLIVLGVGFACAGLVIGGEAGCSESTMLAYLGASFVLAYLPVRLPTSTISLLPAVLLPLWLGCGVPVTALLAIAAVLLASSGRPARPAATWLSLAAVLAGVFVGDLVGLIVLAAVADPSPLVQSIALGTGFAIGSWAGERLIVWIAGRGGLVEAAPSLPRASFVANLLLILPGTILVEALRTRGLLVFGLLLVILVVALALIALYLSAETARRGDAGARERLESIVSQVPDGIFTVRPDLTVEWLNETAARLTGWDQDAAPGQPAAAVVPARRADGTPVDHRDAFLEAARSGGPVHRAATLRARDGHERSVIVSYTALTDRPDAFEVGVAAVRESANDRASQIADLGHELRSPLTAILGYTGLMLGAAPGTIDAERQAEFIARIAASGDYMLRLVNNLLDLRRMESGAEQVQPATLQVDRIIQLVVAMARPRATEKGVGLQIDVESGVPPMSTDELMLRRIVDNLVSNAIKYTPAGGSVTVAMRRRDRGVEIAVTDTGIGLTDEEQRILFQRFFRSRRPEARQERGTGLGLALVQESIRLLGGDIGVTSRVGAGSTFTVTIPPLPATTAAIPTAEATSPR